jgi:addiction module HigA family antidote
LFVGRTHLVADKPYREVSDMGKLDPDPSGGPSDDGPPEHPGAFIRRDLLGPSGLTEQAFAVRLGSSRKTVCQLVCEIRDVTGSTAEKLERLDPRVTAATWMDRQHAYDQWRRRRDRESGSNGHGGGPPRAPS